MIEHGVDDSFQSKEVHKVTLLDDYTIVQLFLCYRNKKISSKSM